MRRYDYDVRTKHPEGTPSAPPKGRERERQKVACNTSPKQNFAPQIVPMITLYQSLYQLCRNISLVISYQNIHIQNRGGLAIILSFLPPPSPLHLPPRLSLSMNTSAETLIKEATWNAICERYNGSLFSVNKLLVD